MNYRNSSFVIGLLTLFLGILVIYGWHTKNISFIQINPAFVPMQYNTALGFFFSGIALVLTVFKIKNLSKVFACIVSLLGLLTLIEYLFSINIGIDELFMKHNIIVETSSPGRMAPNTALCFLISGVSLMLLSSNLSSLKASSFLSSLTLGLGLTAFIGYSVGAEVTYGWGRLTRMAIHTSVGFILLGIGITSFNYWLLKSRVKIKEADFSPWFLGYALALSITLFLIDTHIPLGYAAGVPYILVILLAWFIPEHKYIIWLAILTSILTIGGYLYSTAGVNITIAVVNRVFAIISIWVVALLLKNIKKQSEDLRQTNKELSKNLNILKTQNKELGQFTYIVSHDLQEPLSTLRSFTNLFTEHNEDGKLDEESMEYLTFMSEATERMSDLITALLNYGRIGSERKLVKVDCAKIIETVLMDLRSSITEHNATINIEPLPVINGFEIDLRLLFQNLISNAIKYSKKDTPSEVTIRVTKNKDGWLFFVNDNGIGIAKEYQEKIFGIFQRLHNRDEYEGTGIGLSNCQKIVELHGGRIWLDSELGVGSTFYFKIPFLE